LHLQPLIASGPAFAQTYPDRPVKIVVPFAPAGPTDVIARIVADKLSINLGKQFYVENRAGAGGNTGTAAVATSPPDGHTLIVVSTGFMVNVSLYAKVPYDPVKDFAPISVVAVSPNVLTVNPSVRRRPSRSWSISSRPLPASTASLLRASAARRICRARSSASRRASTW